MAGCPRVGIMELHFQPDMVVVLSAGRLALSFDAQSGQGEFGQWE